MHRLGFVAFAAAAAEFIREHQSTAALIAIVLLVWAITIKVLADRTTWEGPAFDLSGWGTGVSQHSADYLANMDQFAFFARFVSFGLAVFGPLLLVWSLLL